MARSQRPTACRCRFITPRRPCRNSSSSPQSLCRWTQAPRSSGQTSLCSLAPTATAAIWMARRTRTLRPSVRRRAHEMWRHQQHAGEPRVVAMTRRMRWNGVDLRRIRGCRNKRPDCSMNRGNFLRERPLDARVRLSQRQGRSCAACLIRVWIAPCRDVIERHSERFPELVAAAECAMLGFLCRSFNGELQRCLRCLVLNCVCCDPAGDEEPDPADLRTQRSVQTSLALSPHWYIPMLYTSNALADGSDCCLTCFMNLPGSTNGTNIG